MKRSTCKTCFGIIYTKSLKHMVDLVVLPKLNNKPAKHMASKFSSVLEDEKRRLEDNTLCYKQRVDKKCRYKEFKEGDLVMIHLHKERFPVGTYSKFKPQKFGSFLIEKKINDNAYIISLQLNSTFLLHSTYPIFMSTTYHMAHP